MLLLFGVIVGEMVFLLAADVEVRGRLREFVCSTIAGDSNTVLPSTLGENRASAPAAVMGNGSSLDRNPAIVNRQFLSLGVESLEGD